MNNAKFDTDMFVKELWNIRNSWGGIASQEYVADQSGISQSTISRIYNMRSNGYNLTVDHFVRLFNLMADDLQLEEFFKR